MSKGLKIIILCAAGMSSSLIVKSINKSAEKRGISIDISCHPSMTYKELDYSIVDMILVAPQVRGQISEIQQFVSNKIPVKQIGMREYGLIKGDEIFDQVLKTLNR